MNKSLPEPGNWPCHTVPDRRVPPRLVAALYTLLRDHVQPGDMEQVCINCEALAPAVYTNPWLERYASALATYLVQPESDG